MSVFYELDCKVIYFEEKERLKYWSLLSKHIIEKYGAIKYEEPKLVEEVFISCFNYFIELFLAEIKREKNVAFYVYVFGLHEASLKIWKQQLRGARLASIKKSEFAMYRRVLKIILEQSCDLDLFVGEDITIDLVENEKRYQDQLAEMIYLGSWIYGFAEQIAHLKVIGGCHGVEIGEDGQLVILTYQPFPILFDELEKDYYKHNSKVIIDSNGIKTLKTTLLNAMGVDYNKAGSFLSAQIKDPNQTYGLIKINELIASVSKEFNYSLPITNDFFDGVTLSRSNKLSIDQSILRAQEIERYLYRPILKLNTQVGEVALIGIEKWSESIIQLATNAIPWGYAPKEWSKYSGFKKYLNEKELHHDNLLEDPIEKLLKDRGMIYSHKLVSFNQKSSQNIRCDIQDVGEMDFVFLDEKNKIIYVCECKYNRSRFDMVAWYKEYSNFINTYEDKLNNKVGWLSYKKLILEEHFKIVSGRDDINLRDFTVRGIFIINAPNFYMYDGKFRVFTLNSFEELIDGKFMNDEYLFQSEDGKKSIHVVYPYFRNAMKQMYK